MTKYLLLVIILFFFGTRIFKITEIPASVYWDEASIGYNAFSITQDLRDEWGEFLPLHFRAFGEFKLPVYIYTVSIFTEIFGLGELAVRLPAVFYSIGAIIIFYLLVAKTSGENGVGLLAAFILSVSPWLFIFSRTGYEVTAGLFFFLLFLYFLLLYQSKAIYMVIAAISGVLSLYSYNAFRIIVPIFLVLWMLTKFREINKNIKPILLAFAIFLVSFIPLYRLYRIDQGAVRLTTVGVGSPTEVISNYFSHFEYKFLFFDGDINNRSQQPGWGQLYLIELPLIIFGIWRIMKGKNKFLWIFPFLVLVGPIPSAITKEAPHALRAIIMTLGFSGFSAIGVWHLSKVYSKYKLYILSLVVFSYLLSFETYYSDFIKKYNSKTSSDWQYEYKQIFKISRSGQVTDEYAQPYIFALYYLKYPPKKFRETVRYNPPDKWGFSTVYSFDNFVFKKQ